MDQNSIRNIRGMLQPYISQMDGDPDDIIDSFIFASRNASSEAVSMAVGRFVEGSVEGWNPSFVMKPAEFGPVVRQCQKEIEYEALRKEALSRPRIDRQPEPTIKSIIKLFRQKSSDDLYAQPTGATDYYLERLQTLSNFAQHHPQRYYYFDTENDCTDTDRLLSQLQQWIGMAEALSPEYGSFAKTGVAGAGDTSPLIHTGKILPDFQEALDDVALDATLLQQATQAYQSCRQQLIHNAKDSLAST